MHINKLFCGFVLLCFSDLKISDMDEWMESSDDSSEEEEEKNEEEKQDKKKKTKKGK